MHRSVWFHENDTLKTIDDSSGSKKTEILDDDEADRQSMEKA